mgnify:CR=1 FL=1
MPLVISLREKTSIPVEVDSVRLEAVREQSLDEVRQTRVQYGNKQVPLAEFFDVSGSAANDQELVWEGDCSHVKLIGSELSAGRIRVEGNAGMHLGAEMSGGEILVTGNAADWVGAEMHGGIIRVKGNAGHLVGSAYRGGHRGMTDGLILIDGNAGNEIGHSMRRGLIAVGGNAGDAVGFAMIAGTILICGQCGIRPGAGMKRGTIALVGTDESPAMLPTFRYDCQYQPAFLRWYFQQLTRHGFCVPAEAWEANYRRHSGDLLELGKGEILVRA